MKRFAALDALRGIASASVFFSHVHGALLFGHRAWIDLTPAYFLWAGSEAVILFFVLSGFVLSNRALVGKPQGHGAFLVGRFVRIGGPYLVVTAVCMLAVSLLSAWGFSASPRMPWAMSFDWPLVLQHVLMVSNFNSMAFNDVTWTLTHELRFALLFPVFLMAIRTRVPMVLLGALLLLSIASGASLAWWGDASQGYRTAYVYTAHYLIMFALGGLLFRHMGLVTAHWLALPAARRKLIMLAAALIYAYARLVYMVPQQLHWAGLAVFNRILSEDMVALASCVLMLAAMTERSWQAWLHAPALQYLGRVSFSLYLVHLPVMKFWFTVMPSDSPMLALLGSVPSVLLLTHVFHRFIEEPAQRLARDWGARVAEGIEKDEDEVKAASA